MDALPLASSSVLSAEDWPGCAVDNDKVSSQVCQLGHLDQILYLAAVLGKPGGEEPKCLPSLRCVRLTTLLRVGARGPI